MPTREEMKKWAESQKGKQGPNGMFGNQFVQHILDAYDKQQAQQPTGIDPKYEQNLQDVANQYQQFLGQPSNVSQFNNPYANQMNQQLGNMGNTQSAEQAMQAMLQQFAPGQQLQSGQGINWQNPQLNQTQMPANVQQFLQGQSGRDQYGVAGLGAGGQAVQNYLGSGMPNVQGGLPQFDMSQTNAARTGQLAGLQGMLNQPGMTQQQMDTIAQGTLQPVQRALAEQQTKQLGGASARGLGRSSVYGDITNKTKQAMSDATAQTYGNLNAQNVGMQNQNRQFGLQGLGQFGQTGYNQQLGLMGLGNQRQSIANQFAGNKAQMGLGLAGMQQGGQQFAQQMNARARDQQFGEQAQRAGMGANLYNAQAGRNLQKYQGDQSNQINQQNLNQADRRAGDSNMMNLMGLGMGAGQQNFNQQNQLLNQLLNAGNQSMSAHFGTQGDRMREEAARYGLALPGQQNIAQNLYGSNVQQGQFKDQMNFNYQQLAEQIRQFEEQNKGGGIMDFIASVGPQALSFIPGLGGSKPAAPQAQGSGTGVQMQLTNPYQMNPYNPWKLNGGYNG